MINTESDSPLLGLIKGKSGGYSPESGILVRIFNRITIIDAHRGSFQESGQNHDHGCSGEFSS